MRPSPRRTMPTIMVNNNDNSGSTTAQQGNCSPYISTLFTSLDTSAEVLSSIYGCFFLKLGEASTTDAEEVARLFSNGGLPFDELMPLISHPVAVNEDCLGKALVIMARSFDVDIESFANTFIEIYKNFNSRT